MYKNFVNKYLEDVKWATKEVSKKELWDVSGRLKGRSNQILKFDVRALKKDDNEGQTKKGSSRTKADKILMKDDVLNIWIIVDVPTLHQYIVESQNPVITLEILKQLDWTIILKI